MYVQVPPMGKKQNPNPCFFWYHLGVSKNSGTPKWMVYNGKPEHLIKMDDLGGKPTIFGNIHFPKNP